MWNLLLACLQTVDVSGDDSAPVDTEQDLVDSDAAERIDPSDLPSVSAPCREPVLVRVQDVIDGDTAWVDPGGTSEKVRFIGIDAPEMSDGGECFSGEATQQVREALEGHLAWLTFDAECEDHYGRTLAYLHTAPTTEGFVQRSLLRGGWVSVFEVPPNSGFAETFVQDEAHARGLDAGLWGACP